MRKHRVKKRSRARRYWRRVEEVMIRDTGISAKLLRRIRQGMRESAAQTDWTMYANTMTYTSVPPKPYESPYGL